MTCLEDLGGNLVQVFALSSQLFYFCFSFPDLTNYKPIEHFDSVLYGLKENKGGEGYSRKKVSDTCDTMSKHSSFREVCLRMPAGHHQIMRTSPAVNGTSAITTFHNNFHQCSFFLFVSSGGACLVSSV